MVWIVLVLLAALLIYGGIRFIKWIMAPSYWHKYDGGYYITKRKELSEKDKKKLKKLQRKR